MLPFCLWKFSTPWFQAKAQPETETTVATVAPVAPVAPAPVAPVEAEATKAASELQESRCV
jgi:hypothetical protein